MMLQIKLYSLTCLIHFTPVTYLPTKSEKCGHPNFPTNWTKGLFCKIGLYYLKYPFLFYSPFNPVKLQLSMLQKCGQHQNNIRKYTYSVCIFTLQMMFPNASKLHLFILILCICFCIVLIQIPAIFADDVQANEQRSITKAKSTCLF